MNIRELYTTRASLTAAASVQLIASAGVGCRWMIKAAQIWAYNCTTTTVISFYERDSAATGQIFRFNPDASGKGYWEFGPYKASATNSSFRLNTGEAGTVTMAFAYLYDGG